MSWIVGVVWAIALLIALTVLGLCGYDLAGKSKRLAKDLEGMRTLRDQLASLHKQVVAAQQRLPGRPGE